MLKNVEFFKEYAEYSYQSHKKNNNKDYEYCGKVQGVDLDAVKDLKFQERYRLFGSDELANKTTRMYDLVEACKDNRLDMLFLDEDHRMVQYLKDLYNLKHISVHINCQRSGDLIGLHKDSNSKLSRMSSEKFLISKVKKYIIFLSPWTEGQVFMLGQSAYTNWKAQDSISFPWYMPHATANASSQDRYLMLVSGIEN